MSFEIKNHLIFYTKTQEYKNVDCTICRQSLENDSIYAKEDNTFSLVKSGLCGHTFHNECIEPWLNKYKSCPICTKTFE
jgi:protein-arginine kinase activator protein McsA